LIFLGTYKHHILDFIFSFQVYCIIFKLKLIIKKKPQQTFTLEHIKYICVKKIHVTNYEKLQIYFKIKVMGGIL
jgi:hypothetical protein